MVIDEGWSRILRFAVLLLFLSPISADGGREPAPLWDVPLEMSFQDPGAGIAIENARCRLDGFGSLGGYELLGEICNYSDSAITGIAVDALLLAPNEETVSSDQVTMALQVIAPGERAPFRGGSAMRMG